MKSYNLWWNFKTSTFVLRWLIRFSQNKIIWDECSIIVQSFNRSSLFDNCVYCLLIIYCFEFQKCNFPFAWIWMQPIKGVASPQQPILLSVFFLFLLIFSVLGAHRFLSRYTKKKTMCTQADQAGKKILGVCCFCHVLQINHFNERNLM